jgi:hypothetical protein
MFKKPKPMFKKLGTSPKDLDKTPPQSKKPKPTPKKSNHRPKRHKPSTYVLKTQCLKKLKRPCYVQRSLLNGKPIHSLGGKSLRNLV